MLDLLKSEMLSKMYNKVEGIKNESLDYDLGLEGNDFYYHLEQLQKVIAQACIEKISKLKE